MSLFKARDWWSASLGEGEEFDQGCLCVGNVDNSGNGHGQCVERRGKRDNVDVCVFEFFSLQGLICFSIKVTLMVKTLLK